MAKRAVRFLGLERIPRTFHFVFGLRTRPEPLHLIHYLCLESCLQINEPDAVIVHHGHKPRGRYWKLLRDRVIAVPVERRRKVPVRQYRDLETARHRYAHETDFLRLELLLAEGGVYADLDTLFLAPIPSELYRQSFVLGREANVVQRPDEPPSPALCNALLMSEPDAQFGRQWLERMPHVFDGSWSTHSTELPQLLQSRHPELVHVEPERSFYPFMWTRERIADMLERPVPCPVGAYSMHLWAHLWWRRGRRDFSDFHAGLLTEDYVRGGRTTYAREAKLFLAAPATDRHRLRIARAEAAEPNRRVPRVPRLQQLATRRERRLLLIAVRRRFSDRASFRRSGIRWTVPSWDEYIGWSICANGSYDADHRDALLRVMETWGRIGHGRDLVVEVGANFGSHTLPFALAGLRVLAIEPVPFLFGLLQQNVRLNRLTGSVRFHRVAISRRPGEGQLLVPERNGGGGELTRDGIPATFEPRLRAITVVRARLEPLDGVLEARAIEASEVAFVWSDTQGSEAEVIASGHLLWEAGVPLYAELWPRGLEQQASLSEFMALAAQHFKSFLEADDLVAGRLTPRPLKELAELVDRSQWHSNQDWHSDVLLLPEPALA